VFDILPVLAKLLALFILVPLVELYLFLIIGSRIGLHTTLAIIVFTGILGAALTKAQGARALAKFRLASAEGSLPHQEVLDGLLILLAGAVLLTPGFLTDAVGFALLVPPVRAILRDHLGTYLKSKIKIVPPMAQQTEESPIPPAGSGRVIDVEVVEDD
jgi:UPF0716 protein FxsA